jgi:hypothetical protein
MDDLRADKLLNLLGLARRAGRLAVGFSAVEKLVRRGERPLVIVAKDIGSSQRAKVARWEPVAGFVDDILTSDDLAARLGREKLVVVGVSDPGFIKGIAKLDL